MLVPVFDTESNELVGETQMPDDILDAAIKVEAWLKTQPKTMAIHGVTLADE